ncbi:AraC family transcriptional regulator [Solidesulfovibrio sp.]|uniref:AraC family transcriptional regulator n=1 Tax=Solidesulfovibrio sp. TaxID=2910990 RepID=UPI0026128010|nr:AraC family transcriptional regulator [Solidesulfovibrio sp.]
MDPLSDMLALLRPRNTLSAGFDAGGRWSVRFPAQPGSIKCGAVVTGECLLVVEDVAEATRLRTGDAFLLPRGRPFRLASDLDAPPAEAREVFGQSPNGGITAYGGGGDCFLVSCRFILADRHADLLLGLLPPVVRIRDAPGKAALRWGVERMMEELREGLPGGDLLVRHLAHMMLVQVLRRHLADVSHRGAGWLHGLADGRIGQALAAMHADPAHPFTLGELAARVGMSRSTFAQRFKETVGASAMDYLTRWRMLLAGDRLAHSADSVAAVAALCGYASESAFGTAFKRVMGCSPRQYVRGRGPGRGPGEADRADLPEPDAVCAAAR